MDEITSNDKLMAALSYPIGIVAIVILLVEDMKSRPFQKYHAVQALAVNVVLIVLTFYWAYLAYQGQYFDIPGLTPFLKGQGWLE